MAKTDFCEYQRCGGLGEREVAHPRAARVAIELSGHKWRVCESCGDLVVRRFRRPGESAIRTQLGVASRPVTVRPDRSQCTSRPVTARQRKKARKLAPRIQADAQVAALCRSCGWITIFRKWPERLKRVSRKNQSRGCVKCNGGPIVRLPDVGFAKGSPGLRHELAAYAESSRLGLDRRRTLLAMLTRAEHNLAERDAAILERAVK